MRSMPAEHARRALAAHVPPGGTAHARCRSKAELGGEAEWGTALDAGAAAEEGAGERLGGQRVGGEAVDHAGDVQVAIVWAAEGGAGNLHSAWDADDGVELAIGQVAVDYARAVQSDPHRAFGIDGHAVGQTCFSRNVYEGAPTRQRAVRSIEIKEVD